MPSALFKQLVELAGELGDEERGELAARLLSTLRHKLSGEWQKELTLRVTKMNNDDARSVGVGFLLSFDEMVEFVAAPGASG